MTAPAAALSTPAHAPASSPSSGSASSFPPSAPALSARPPPAPTSAPAALSATTAPLASGEGVQNVTPPGGLGSTALTHSAGTVATGESGVAGQPGDAGEVGYRNGMPGGASMYGGGMDPYGMGMGYPGMGMMGGMGGMGGLGMMGMGGMGMMGMGMYGMTPEAQRAQVMMFMMGRIVELWGMFTQVVQSTFGSATQYVGNSNGIRQTMNAMEAECREQERVYSVHEKERIAAFKELPSEVLQELQSQSRRERKKSRVAAPREPSFFRKVLRKIVRHCIILVLSLFITSRIQNSLLK